MVDYLPDNVDCVRTAYFPVRDSSYYTFVNKYGAPLFCESFILEFGHFLPSVDYEIETPLVKYIRDLGIL